MAWCLVKYRDKFIFTFTLPRYCYTAYESTTKRKLLAPQTKDKLCQ